MADPAENPTVRHERSDMTYPAVLGSAAATVLLVVGALVGVWLLFRSLDAHEKARKATNNPLVEAERDRLAALAPDERTAEHAGRQPPLEGLPPGRPIFPAGRWQSGVGPQPDPGERERLDSYGWVDRDKGVVRVPLDRAARMALEHKDTYLKARPKKE